MTQVRVLFGQAWKLFRDNAVALLITTGVLLVPMAVVMALGNAVASRVAQDVPGAGGWPYYAGKIAVGVVETLVTMVSTAAAVVFAAERAAGRDLTWQLAWRRALDRIGALLWTTLVLVPRVLGWVLLCAVPLAIAIAVLWDAAPPMTFFAVIMVPTMVVILVRYGLVSALVVVEDVSGRAAIARNLELLRGNWLLAGCMLIPVTVIAMLAGFGAAKVAVASQGANQLFSIVTTAVQAAITVVLLRALVAKAAASSAVVTEPAPAT